MIVFDVNCTLCPRLAAFLAEGRALYPTYHCRPVAPFGDAQARLLLVGLAPGFHGANATGRPFTGDYAGILLYETLYEFGWATAPVSVSADDGLRLVGCRISNSVKCVPPGNKPLPAEIATCNRYLAAELQTVDPGTVLLALGAIAHGAVLRALGLRQSACKFAHGAQHALPRGLRLIDSYHCSRYNTNTGRLTAQMFRDVVGRATEMARGSTNAAS
jgi:uracil-DNA glycosylase